MKHLLFVLTLFCALTIDAQTFVTLNDVRYLIEDDHAVVARQDRELTGNITIPVSIEYNNTSYNVTRLMSPDDSESGGGGAFQECGITGITLPEAITEIPNETFHDCTQLSSVTLLGPVTRIGSSAFARCRELTTIDLPDDVTEMGQWAFYATGLTQFTIPAGLTVLEPFVLCDTKIINIEIPATVKTIYGSSLATNQKNNQGQPLGRSVKMFQRDCRLIEYNYDAFGDMTTIDLLVPAGGKVVYQEYYPWSNMHSITEFGEDTGEPLVVDQHHITIDGIRYLIKNGEASVDIQPATLSGEITILDKVTYEGNDYPVTSVVEAYGSNEDFYHTVSVLSETEVTKITLPSSIKTIGYLSFRRSPYLQEVVMNDGITKIGEGAFGWCSELTTINIPSTVTVLPKGIFEGCDNLKTLTLQEGLTFMDFEALWHTSIETLTIPSTCTTFGSRPLDLPKLETLIMKVKEPADIRVMGPYNLETMSSSVFGIYNNAFNTDYGPVREYFGNIDLIVPLGCKESYEMLEPWLNFGSITEEGSEYYQPKKIAVNIDGINYMLEETLNGQNETKRIATIARQNPSLSGDIVIPEKVSYAKKVLQGNEWVTLEAQDYDVTALYDPIINFNGDPRPSDGCGAFQGCAITSISLPATITVIPANTFYSCRLLKNVELPEGVTTIRTGAFANCISLEEIYLPETITDMSGDQIFCGCTSLKKVNIPKYVTTPDPEECLGLGHTLGNGCFAHCGIETFIIPENVTSIGEGCFGALNEWDDYHHSLKSIKICHKSYSDNSFSFPESIFNDVSGITLIVPEGTKESLYSQVYPWKNFGNIIEYKDQGDEHQYNAYSVSYEEEVIGHEQEASDDTTILDYIPSGVDTALPEETEKEDYVVIDWKDKQNNTPQAVMPAQDMLLRLTLALLGDANRDGDVDVSDFLSVANHILGRSPVGFLYKAANTSKSGNALDVADFLGVANVILRGVHYSNPHHAPARRTASNTDISAMDNAIYIEPTSVCAGLEQTLSVKMKNANPVAGFEFSLQLPEGITVTGASLSDERTTSEKTSLFSHNVLNDGTVKVLCGTMTQNPETEKLYTFDGNDGEVATITISVDPNMVLGDYSALITNAKLADADSVKTTISNDVESVITVSDVLILDENSTVTPPTTNDVPVTVTVRRTINANEWSTICLPFDMTKEQLKDIFGNDVQLAMFSSYDAVKDGDNVTGITINFTDVDLASDGFYGNYPYIIRTSRDITEFTLTAVVYPENEVVANYSTGTVKPKVLGSFIGTYKAKTVVPDNSLVLYNNKFYYSAGLTKMKAFRAYFTLDDVLADVKQASARIMKSFDDDTTGINEKALKNHEQPNSEKYYNLMGQRVTMPKKGLLVKEGKKIVVK